MILIQFHTVLQLHRWPCQPHDDQEKGQLGRAKEEPKGPPARLSSQSHSCQEIFCKHLNERICSKLIIIATHCTLIKGLIVAG